METLVSRRFLAGNDMGTSVTLKDIRTAAAQIRGHIVDTPCVPSRRLSEIPGLVPSLKRRIEGCAFASRCALATDQCRHVAPALAVKARGHLAACHHAPVSEAVA